MASGKLQTKHKAAATHLEALGFKCLGFRAGKKRDYYMFEYSEQCKAALLSFEQAFKTIQNVEPIATPSDRAGH